MFLPNSAVPSVAEASIQALCPSLNTPVLNIEQLPVGPARAAILLFGGDYGNVCLAVGVRSLETSEVVIFNYQGDACDFSSVGAAVGAALSFAEGMGFLFEDDLIASGGANGRERAMRIWESLSRATEADPDERESTAAYGAFEPEEPAEEEELDLVELAGSEIEPSPGAEGGELLLEESVAEPEEISYEEPPSESPRELDAAREPEAAAAAASGVVEDADATALRTPTSQMRILTKFRGAGAEPSPIDVDDPVNGEARPEIGRVPVESLSADRDRKPKLLARLLGSF
jgi:hypothetical protein